MISRWIVRCFSWHSTMSHPIPPTRCGIRALFTFITLGLLLLITESASAQSVDWTTVDRAGGGVGWDNPPTHGGTGTPGPATQSFVNLGGTGVTMTVSYSGNMWDNRSTPNLYADEAPIDSVRTALRWTNNPADSGGTPGTPTGPTELTITFSQPVFLSDFTLSTLSQLLNNTRYEWIDIRALDEKGAPVVATSFTPGTYDSNNVLTTRPNSPLVIDNGSGLYRVRGTSIQGNCADVCAYDRLAFDYTTTPVQQLILHHFTTTGATVDSPRSSQQTSIALESFTLRLPEDFGDLPEGAGYATTLANNGPRHQLSPELFLGATVDFEADGRPSSTATGDDAAPAAGPDDEDGVNPADLTLQGGTIGSVRVRATNRTATSATLTGWIDLNANGQFDPTEAAQTTVPAATENSEFTLDFGLIPNVAVTTTTYARFRLSTDPNGTAPTGAATDGEVEDDVITLLPFVAVPPKDYGDAPAGYQGNGNGPMHGITDTLFLGTLIDAEESSQPTINADGDDTTPAAGPDDEDGVAAVDLTLVESRPAQIRVRATNQLATAAQLYGWIDFDGNGTFDVTERRQIEIPMSSDNRVFVLDFGIVPPDSAGTTYARFRLSTDATAGDPLAAAGDGEVEDYPITIAPKPPVAEPQPYFRTRFSGGTPATVVRPTGVTAAALVDPFPASSDDRNPDALFSFETALDPVLTTVTDESDDGFNRQWGPATMPAPKQAFRGEGALWVAAGGTDGLDPNGNAMPANLHTWFTLGAPLNLVGVQQADIEFRLDLETEPRADEIFVGVSVDNVTYRGVTWSGNTGGWEYFDLDLRDYLGYPEVYVAWTFVSDGANADGKAHGGAWLDQIAIWTYVDTPPATELAEPVQNGGFETGDLAEWIVPPQSTVDIVNTTSQVDGDFVAELGGNDNATDQLSQPITAPGDTEVLAALRFWFNLFGEETTQNNDRFCARLYGDNGGTIDQSNELLNLGCLDGVEAATPAFDPDAWRLVEWQFGAEQWETIAGQTVHILFEVTTNATLPTTVYVDGISISIVTDGTPGDALEPNDFTRVAVTTTITGTTSITFDDLTIDPAFDVDLFAIFADAGDTIVVNVDAVRNGSPLDAALRILDPDGQLLCQNDDDPYDSDPYVECPAAVSGIYHAEVTSFSDQGNRDQRYTLTIEVIAPNSPLPENPPPPAPPTPPTVQKSWTAMIYMDGDTDLCGDYQFFQLIERLERDLGDRIGPGGFLNVVVLFDRIDNGGRPCNSGGTTRYAIQPNGEYTVDINIWQPGLDYNMGDPETFVHFVTWAMRNYPAEHYYLAIENHGNGIAGIAWDYTSRDRVGRLDQLTNRELHSALKTITDNGERPLDILAYEACLMGTYENAFDAREFADYLFFFPTVSYTNNASYPAYLGNANLTAASTGRALGELMFDIYQEAVTVQPYVMTLVDTAAVDALHGAINAWADVLIAALPTARAEIALARQLAQKVDSTTRGDEFQPQLTAEDYYLDLWDLADLLEARGIAPNESRAVKAAVEAVVLRSTQRSRNALDYSRSRGLTLYWPKTASGYYRGYVNDEIYSSTTEGRWDEFLQAYFDEDTGGLPASDGPVRRERATDAGLIYLPLVAR